jgi:hypothetical protein
VLPLLVALLAQRSVADALRTRIVWSVGLGYLGIVLLLTWQAMRGQPLLTPDAITVGALGVVVLAALAVVLPRGRVSVR